MEDTQEIDLLEMFNNNKDDDMIVLFLEAVCEASIKLHTAIEGEKTPALAFNEFVKAWEYYSIIPESKQAECDAFIQVFREMWSDVANEEVEFFRFLCEKIYDGENIAEDQLCVVCLELLEAIAVLNGCIPKASSVFVAAINLAESGNVSSNACIALLYILSAKIYYRNLGYLDNVEEVLLSEGIKYHLKSSDGEIVHVTELYALHIASTIYDIICVKRERDDCQEEVSMLAKEGYTILARFDSPQVDFARQSLFGSSGIVAESALYDDSQYLLFLNNGLKRLPN